MRKVMVSGKFDPPHDGHILHIVEASVLGDYLYVVTHTDEVIRKLKGKCEIPLWARMALLKGILKLYNIPGEVVVSVDTDGSSDMTLGYLAPHIYAKGGDRYPGNLPEKEIETCKRIGCRIIYGIGDQINSSSKMEVDKKTI